MTAVKSWSPAGDSGRTEPAPGRPAAASRTALPCPACRRQVRGLWVRAGPGPPRRQQQRWRPQRGRSQPGAGRGCHAQQISSWSCCTARLLRGTRRQAGHVRASEAATVRRPPPPQMFSKGFSSLTTFAGSAAATAREKAKEAHLDQTAAVGGPHPPSRCPSAIPQQSAALPISVYAWQHRSAPASRTGGMRWSAPCCERCAVCRPRRSRMVRAALAAGGSREGQGVQLQGLVPAQVGVRQRRLGDRADRGTGGCCASCMQGLQPRAGAFPPPPPPTGPPPHPTTHHYTHTHSSAALCDTP